jgi:hypothetical protein
MSADARDPAPFGPCPHCGGSTRAEPARLLRWRCGVCGGPVIPAADVERTNRELASLVRAQRARGMAVGWMAAALVFAGIGAMALGLTALVAASAHAAGALFGVVAVVAIGVAVASRARAGVRNREAREAVDEAWQRVAGDLLRARGDSLTAAEMSRAMQTDEAHAEAMLAGLSATGRARVDVRDDAELTYRVAPDAPESAEPDTLGRRAR